MATKKSVPEETQPEVKAYAILSGFIFDHCIYTRGSTAHFSEKSAALLIKRGLIKLYVPVK